jgi:hypothetical protein
MSVFINALYYSHPLKIHLSYQFYHLPGKKRALRFGSAFFVSVMFCAISYSNLQRTILPPVVVKVHHQLHG